MAYFNTEPVHLVKYSCKVQVSEQELEDIHQWKKLHKQTCTNAVFFVRQGGKNGIGVCTYVGCLTCDREQDITDVTIW